MNDRTREALIVALAAVTAVATLALPLYFSRDEPAAAYAAALVAEGNNVSASARVLIHPAFRDDAQRAVRATNHAAAPGATTALSLQSTASVRDVVILSDTTFRLPRRLRARVIQEAHHDGVGVFWLGDDDDNGAFVLDEHIAGAQVRVLLKDGAVAHCPFDARSRRHQCENSALGLGEWMWVGPETVKSGKSTRKCLWSHPHADGEVVTTFAAEHLPDTLTFAAAKADTAFRKPNAPAVRARIRVNGKRVAEVSRTHRKGFIEKTLDLSAFAQPRELEVSVGTTDSGMQHYCFTITSEAAP